MHFTVLDCLLINGKVDNASLYLDVYTDKKSKGHNQGESKEPVYFL